MRASKFIRLHTGARIISVRRTQVDIVRESLKGKYTEVLLRSGVQLEVHDDPDAVIAMVEGRKRVKDQGS